MLPQAEGAAAAASPAPSTSSTAPAPAPAASSSAPSAPAASTPASGPARPKIAVMSSEVVDSNPYSRLMALQRMGIVKDYERIRSKTVGASAAGSYYG